MNKKHYLKIFLLNSAQNYAAHPLFHFAYRGRSVISVSYSQFMYDTAVCTKAAQRIPAQRIAVIGYNSYEWIISSVSLMLAGKTVILMNPDLSDQDLERLLSYTDTECIMLSQELQGELSHLEKKYDVRTFFSGFEKDMGLLDAIAAFCELPERNGEFLCFSSGTTSSSKGVVLSTNMLVRHITHVKNEQCLPWHNGECCFIPLPLHHIFGLTFLMHCIGTGAEIGFSSSPRYLAKEGALLNPDVAVIVPSIFAALLSEKSLMPKLHTVITGGSAFDEHHLALAQERGIELFNGYGSTESIALILYSSASRNKQLLHPLKGIQYGLTEQGELWLRTPYHMDEYYKKPEETARTLKGDILFTGDLAEIDQDGFIKILGRLRDTIVMENGEKIHAADMDSLMLSMPFVKDAAVIYSRKIGMAAVIVPETEGYEDAIRQQIEAYNKTTSPQLRIQNIWFRQEPLPRTLTGKLRRYQLETEYA